MMRTLRSARLAAMTLVVAGSVGVLVETGPTISGPVWAGDSQATASPPGEQPAEITQGVARVAYIHETEEDSRILVVGADGSGPAPLLSGEHDDAFCQSADGSLVAFWSDDAVPGESFVYTAAIDGDGDRTLVSEDARTFWCGFAPGAILLKGAAAAAPIVRHDLTTGEQVEFLSDADRLTAAPDGIRYAFVGGLDMSRQPPTGPASLEVIDVMTIERARLHGPVAEDLSYDSMTWSPDGTAIAFAVGPPSPPGTAEPGAAYESLVSRADGSGSRSLGMVHGLPRYAWSADGSHLLVHMPSDEGVGPLSLIGLARDRMSPIADAVVFAGWHPGEPGTFAYATGDALMLGTVEGSRDLLARPPQEGLCPDCVTGGAPAGEWGWGDWIGWSPDGRHIGLPDFAPVIAVIDVATGTLRILADEPGDGLILGPRWLR